MRIWLETPRGEYEVDHLTLMLVRDNAAVLQAQRLYERALLGAFVETSHATWSLADLYRLLEHADPVRLAAARRSTAGSRSLHALPRGCR